MDLKPGILVNENVRLTRPLSRGAMGEIWVAQHLTLRTDVAVKFITPELGLQHKEVLARFEQEAAMAAQIKSPHVVQTFDLGKTEDGTPYIVMELLEGESLQELIDRVGRLDPAPVLRIAAQVARALGRAHKMGIVHRDIKPDNIYVSQADGEVFCKVLDFGIAKRTKLPAMGGLTSAGVMIGTPEYMSPEQVMSAKDVDHHADLWALAVTVYQALTGELPFVGEAIGDLCVKLLEGRYIAATKLRADLPPELDDFFARAFAPKPVDRYPGTRALVSALNEALPVIQLDFTGTDSMPPVAELPLVPSSRAMTTPGVAPPDDDVLAAQAEARNSVEMRDARSGTLNGSSANREQPAGIRRRGRGRLVAAAIVLGLVATIGAIAAFSGGNGTIEPAAAGPETAVAAGPVDTADSETAGAASQATAPATADPAMSAEPIDSAEPDSSSDPGAGSGSATRRPPTAKPTRRDHGF